MQTGAEFGTAFVKDVLLTRRSVRHYQPGHIKEEDLNLLLKAAMAAPSAGNQQPWHFVVVDDHSLFEQIQSFHPHAKMLREADVGVLICGDLKREKHEGYWVQDCSAATENLLLAAHALGLGAVWLGIYPRMERVDGMRNLLHTPEGIVPFSMVALGLPAERPREVDRFDRSRIHKNKW